MLKIWKLRTDEAIDFAAQELKKYLRMMMPRCGDIAIGYDPKAEGGFRLGLLADFGLPNEAEDPVLDDIVHIDTEADGGILAGSNGRSVLFAVYRFLKLNGCRWLYPGVDGEHIPMQPIVAQKYHHQAAHRFRGHCNEGAESQGCMLETIDFYAKQELNVYMLEFDVPLYYYASYYEHRRNEMNRAPEPVSPEQVLQWKRQCEAEIAKRGLQFHDMGHGWTAEPFGISSADGWLKSGEQITDDQRACLAMLNGKREFFNGVPLNTNLCMSNPKVRSTMAKYIADYAENAANVSYLHVWLADSRRNHCECENCTKMRPSDFYMMIMNELDQELTARALDTRIVFIAYVDTLFPPEQVRIENPRRFSLLYAPIHRSYCGSITEDSQVPEYPAYQRNRWQEPKTAEANLAFLRGWQQVWQGNAFEYEYHFWWHQYLDPGSIYFAKRVYEDVRSLKLMGLRGVVEDGSQRSFFPNGLAMYVYAEALLDDSPAFETIAEDYLSHIYGEGWQQVRSVLEEIGHACDYAWMEGEASEDPIKGSRYAPKHVESLDRLPVLAEQLRQLTPTTATRTQTVSWQLLSHLADYIQGLHGFLREKALGNDAAVPALADAFWADFGKREVAIERYYDHFLAVRAFQPLTTYKPVTTPALQEG